jgi:ABC-2 type transport system permease protein
VQRGGRLSPASALIGMLVVSSGSALFGLPVLAAVALDQPWLLPASWAALGLAGAVVYRCALGPAARLLARRREAVLEAVAGDEEG